jgi:hypothetical protein
MLRGRFEGRLEVVSLSGAPPGVPGCGSWLFCSFATLLCPPDAPWAGITTDTLPVQSLPRRPWVASSLLDTWPCFKPGAERHLESSKDSGSGLCLCILPLWMLQSLCVENLLSHIAHAYGRVVVLGVKPRFDFDFSVGLEKWVVFWSVMRTGGDCFVDFNSPVLVASLLGLRLSHRLRCSESSSLLGKYTLHPWHSGHASITLLVIRCKCIHDEYNILVTW